MDTEKSQSQTDTHDAVADFARGSIAVDQDWTPEEEAAIRRKFDFTITPLVTTLLYMLCAIDRSVCFLIVS